MYRQSEKNLLNSNNSSICPYNTVNFGPLTVEIGSRGDIPAFTPAEAGTRFSDPGCKAVLTLLLRIVMVYPPKDGHPFQY